MQSRTYAEVAAAAREMLPQMARWAETAPYEKKGILYSEILFLLAYMRGLPFRRVLESGRARGQSTLLLASALPDKKIVSVEFDANSEDVPVAAARLQGRDNVELLFGDARKILPAIVQSGDIAIIDGPKEFRAVRLAIKLLATGKVSHVFVHDLYVGTAERAFVEANFPEALYSDHRDYAQTGSLADNDIQDELLPSQRLAAVIGDAGYGFSLTCLPLRANRNYFSLLIRARFADLWNRLFRRNKA